MQRQFKRLCGGFGASILMIACNLTSNSETPSTSGPSVLPSIQDDSYEPDNDFAHATALTTDSTVQVHALVKDSSHSIEYDYVVLQTKPGTDYNIYLVGKPYLPTAYVERPAGGFLNFRVLDSNVNDTVKTQTVSFTAADTLTYIRIGYENHSKVEDWRTQYSITATVLPDARAPIDSTLGIGLDSGVVTSQTMSLAPLILLGDSVGRPGNWTIQSSGWFKIPVYAGRTIFFNNHQYYNAIGVFQASCYEVFNPDSTRIIPEYQGATRQCYSSLYTPTINGFAYIHYEKYNTKPGLTFSYSPLDTNGSNYTQPNAKLIGPGNTPVAGQLNSSGFKWFKMPVKSGGFYAIDHSAKDMCLFIRLISENNDEINMESECYIEPKTPPYYQARNDGYIFIRLNLRTFRILDPTSFPFTLTVKEIADDPNEPANSTLAGATQVPSDTASLNGVLLGNDHDFFKFHADSGSTYIFKGAPSGRILSEDSTQALVGSGDFAFYSPNSSNWYLDLQRNVDSAYQRYSISFSTFHPDSFERDNDMTHARTLGTDGLAQSHNLLGSDEDWMSFSADSGVVYSLGANTTGTLLASVFNEDSLMLGTETPVDSGATQIVRTVMIRRKGTLYIRVAPRMASQTTPISYSIWLKKQ